MIGVDIGPLLGLNELSDIQDRFNVGVAGIEPRPEIVMLRADGRVHRDIWSHAPGHLVISRRACA